MVSLLLWCITTAWAVAVFIVSDVCHLAVNTGITTSKARVNIFIFRKSLNLSFPFTLPPKKKSASCSSLFQMYTREPFESHTRKHSLYEETSNKTRLCGVTVISRPLGLRWRHRIDSRGDIVVKSDWEIARPREGREYNGHNNRLNVCVNVILSELSKWIDNCWSSWNYD